MCFFVCFCILFVFFHTFVLFIFVLFFLCFLFLYFVFVLSLFFEKYKVVCLNATLFSYFLYF